MTDPNVALYLCVFLGFFSLIKKKKICKQAVCHLAGVFVFFRSWETSVKTRFCSPQSTQYSLNQTVLQRTGLVTEKIRCQLSVEALILFHFLGIKYCKDY